MAGSLYHNFNKPVLHTFGGLAGTCHTIKSMLQILAVVMIWSQIFSVGLCAISAEEALTALKTGNTRFQNEKSVHPHQTKPWRDKMAIRQTPKAVVLTCSDSRVPPELVFDQGIGDLFVIRVAGNSVDDLVLGSIEYAVDHLKTPLIVVLGHQNCGAVKAALESIHDLEGRLGSVVDPIAPAVAPASSPDRTAITVKNHVINMVGKLKESRPILTKALKEKDLEIVGGVYSLDSGKIEFFNY